MLNQNHGERGEEPSDGFLSREHPKRTVAPDIEDEQNRKEEKERDVLGKRY